jgi:hypothetical protein
MKFDRTYIFIISILGIILLYSYYYYGTTTKNPLRLWGRIDGNFRNVYYLSMILSTIGFLLLFYYLINTNVLTTDNINNIFYGLLGIVVISIFWMPLSIEYLNKKSLLYKFLIIFVLLLVAISTLYVIYILNSIKDTVNPISHTLALYGMIYFFIHAFFFDSLLWSFNFF